MKQVHIIGGGIIGLTSAWYLNQAGVDVTVIDKTDLTDSTSHGNAGMIVPSHFVPLASPGVISQGIKWMFDRRSPFYIKPQLDLSLLNWLWKFYRACNAKHVQDNMLQLYEFNKWSKELYREFERLPEFDFCFKEDGLLMLYHSKHQEKEEIEMAHKAMDLGLNVEILNDSGVQSLQPNLQLKARGGVFFKDDAHLYPNLFISKLQANLKEKGVNFIHNCEVVNGVTTNGKLSKLILNTGQDIQSNEVVLAGGTWTAQLLKKLGIPLLLQSGKGYSFTLHDIQQKPTIPTILTEAKVAITPMGNDLRIGGTLELGGYSKKINKNRLEGIINCLPNYYNDHWVDTANIPQDIWIGYRPCSPDGLPYLGRSNQLDNLIIATGHGMMGMSMGPATGKLVSQIALKYQPSIDIKNYNPNR